MASKEQNAEQRQAAIHRFLTEKVAPTIPTADGETVGAVLGQGFYWRGSELFSKPPERAKTPARVKMGKWDGESLYLYLTESGPTGHNLGRDTLAAARALGIPVVNIPEPEPETEASEDTPEPEPETESKPAAPTKRSRGK